LLEAAVVGVDIVDVKVRRLGRRFSRRGQGVKGNLGPARERRDGLPAVTDEMVARRDDASEGVADRALST
jgi:hypothetical protein